MPNPDASGHWGEFGGRFVPEALIAALDELEAAHTAALADPAFTAELEKLGREYGNLPSPLYFAERLTKKLGGAKIYLKREDLAHTGAHKINNAIGQGLLARRMKKPRGMEEGGPASGNPRQWGIYRKGLASVDRSSRNREGLSSPLPRPRTAVASHAWIGVHPCPSVAKP